MAAEICHAARLTSGRRCESIPDFIAREYIPNIDSNENTILKK